MTALFYALGVLIFAVAIMASIALHELGHMIPAKRFGGKVTQYFIGFGPTVWSRQVGETEYGVKAIPLGGYVKIVGMLPPGATEVADELTYDEDGRATVRIRKSNTGMFTQLISDARAAEWEHISAGDTDRLFYRMPWWKKVIVMAGGPTVNLLIAFFVFWGVFATFGNPGDREPIQNVVSRVSECVPAYSGTDECAAGRTAPAAAAGLEVGDRVVAVGGERVETWEELTTAIRGRAGEKVAFTVERDGAELPLEPVALAEIPVEQGSSETQGFLGMAPTLGEPTNGGPVYTLQQMDTMLVETVKSIAELPVRVYDVGLALLGLQERDPEGPVSVVGGGRFAGEIAAEESFELTQKTATLFMLIAGFNFFIGMFNFVPLLPLDGGHIAGALWEGIRRRWAKIFRRPDPGYVDVAKLLPIAYVMALAFVAMAFVLITADIFIPIRLYS
jgi:membrane-associated protease RseP (regulator of RpoE activity)